MVFGIWYIYEVFFLNFFSLTESLQGFFNLTLTLCCFLKYIFLKYIILGSNPVHKIIGYGIELGSIKIEPGI